MCEYVGVPPGPGMASGVWQGWLADIFDEQCRSAPRENCEEQIGGGFFKPHRKTEGVINAIVRSTSPTMQNGEIDDVSAAAIAMAF